MYAARHGHSSCCNSLVQQGANLNLQSDEGHSALMLATMESHFDVATGLLHHGAAATARDVLGNTVLMFAAAATAASSSPTTTTDQAISDLASDAVRLRAQDDAAAQALRLLSGVLAAAAAAVPPPANRDHQQSSKQEDGDDDNDDNDDDGAQLSNDGETEAAASPMAEVNKAVELREKREQQDEQQEQEGKADSSSGGGNALGRIRRAGGRVVETRTLGGLMGLSAAAQVILFDQSYDQSCLLSYRIYGRS